MAFLSTLDIAGSALTAERFRMNIAMQNLSNINTTRTEEEGVPYKRKQVIFQERALNFEDALRDESYKLNQGGVRVTEVVENDRDFRIVLDPTHPDADAEGYVKYPNVNRTEEYVDLMAASRVYEANLTALNVVKSLAVKALEIGK